MREYRYFSYDELAKFTKQFQEESMVGSGAFGKVYKGIQDDGELIAVKKLHPLQGLDNKAFDNEFHNLSNVLHPNMVRLLGYCHESRRKFIDHEGKSIVGNEEERALCFEYVQGGSLDKYITEERCNLDWLTCYGVIKGTIEGLNHLHTVKGGPIYHRDLKPANILLDKNMIPKIADLGLSKIVASTGTYITQSNWKGTLGFMPPEYADSGTISPTFDVFSLGVVIIGIMDGKAGNLRRYEMPRQEFVDRVTKNWMERLQGTSRSSQEINMLQVETCVDIALRCVEADRRRRPHIQKIVNDIKELEEKIKMMSQSSNHPKSLHGQTSCYSNVIAVDPSVELRFPFEPMKEFISFLQLTNKTDVSVAYNIKTNTKYCSEPNKGILPPCSRTYICVTMQAQEDAPPNMHCVDVLHVQCAHASKGETSDQINEGFFEKVIGEKRQVDEVTLPIVYIALDQFRSEEALATKMENTTISQPGVNIGPTTNAAKKQVKAAKKPSSEQHDNKNTERK